MQETPNLKLKKPDLTDYVSVADLNENADKIDTAVQTEKERITTHLADYERFKTDVVSEMADSAFFKTIKLDKDSEGVFTVIERRRSSDGSLMEKSVLSGGASPLYTTRTVTYYESDGLTVKNTYVYTLSYDIDDALVSEV